MIYFVPTILAITFVLITNWNEQCKTPLRTWLLLLLFHHVFSLGFTVVILKGLPSPIDSLIEQDRK